MDLKELGSIVAEQMDVIERDCPEDTTVVAALTCVILTHDHSEETRVRISVPVGPFPELDQRPNIWHRKLIRGILEYALQEHWI
jgi:hypothetical protein